MIRTVLANAAGVLVLIALYMVTFGTTLVQILQDNEQSRLHWAFSVRAFVFCFFVFLFYYFLVVSLLLILVFGWNQGAVLVLAEAVLTITPQIVGIINEIVPPLTRGSSLALLLVFACPFCFHLLFFSNSNYECGETSHA